VNSGMRSRAVVRGLYLYLAAFVGLVLPTGSIVPPVPR
jgi:hypothetical protein